MSLKLAFVLEAVDKATEKVRNVNRSIDRLTEPARKVRASFTALVKESRFDRVRSALGDLAERGRGFMDTARGIAGGLLWIGAAAGGAFLAIKRTVDVIDQAVDTSKMLGITVEMFQQLGYAAKLNGSSEEEMGDALRFLSRNMVEAINGSQEATLWFTRVGIPLERLRKMNVVQVIEAIADKFKKVGDANGNAEKKIAAMMAMLGRSGAGLKQVLDLGSEGMREFYAEAQRLGAVVKQADAEAMADFNDSFDRMKTSVFGVMSRIASAALPVLDSLVKRFTDWAVANRALIATRVTDFFEALVDRLPAFLTAVVQIGTALASIAALLNTVAQFFGGWDNVLVMIAATIAGKVVFSLGLMAQALWGVGAAFLATPFGWVVAGIAAVAAGAVLVYTKWEPIKRFFVGLWDSITAGIQRLNNALPSWFKRFTLPGMAIDAAASIVAPSAAPAPSAIAAGAGGRTEVGGTLKIAINSEGRPRVTELQSKSRAMDIDVWTGQVMTGL